MYKEFFQIGLDNSQYIFTVILHIKYDLRKNISLISKSQDRICSNFSYEICNLLTIFFLKKLKNFRFKFSKKKTKKKQVHFEIRNYNSTQTILALQ